MIFKILTIFVGIFLVFTLIYSDQEAYSHTQESLPCGIIIGADMNCFELGSKEVCVPTKVFPFFSCHNVKNAPNASIKENWVFRLDASITPCSSGDEVVIFHTKTDSLRIFIDCNITGGFFKIKLQSQSVIELQKNHQMTVRSITLKDNAKLDNFGKVQSGIVVSTGTQVINNGEILLKDDSPSHDFTYVEGKIINNKKFVIGTGNQDATLIIVGGGAFKNNDELEIKTHRKTFPTIFSNELKSPCPDSNVAGDLCFRFAGGLTIRGILDNFFDIINTGSIDIGARNVHTNQKSLFQWGGEHIPGKDQVAEGNTEKLLVNKKNGLIKNLPGGIINNEGRLFNDGYIEFQCGSTVKNLGEILNLPGGVIAGVVPSVFEGNPIQDKGTLEKPAFIVENCEPDVEPPVIILQDLTAECNGKSGTSVDFGTIATDNRHPNPKVTPDGDTLLFSVGTTTPVDWTVTDGVRLSAAKTTTVTIEDTTPPEMTPPPDVIVKSNTSKVPSNSVNLGTPTVDDICASKLTVRKDVPQEFEVGENIVTWSAKDPSGNISFKTQKVLVVPQDEDGDGIADIVDTLPTEFSNDFEDVPIGGETGGNVITRGDQVIGIFEEEDQKGVLITTYEPVVDTTAAQISACGNSALLRLTFGDKVIVTCSSVTIEALSGSVDVEFDTRNIPATTTMIPLDILTYDDKTITFTNNSLTNVAIIKVGNRTFTLLPGESITIYFPTDKTSYQDPNLGDVRHGEGHDNGFCMNQNCMNVDGFFNHFPETIVPQGSTQTFSLLINCPRGVNTCNHASIEGVLPDSDFYDEQWGVTIDRVPRSDTWETTINNPYGEIGEVTTTVQEVGQSFLSVSFNIEFLIPGSIGTADGLRVAHENNRFLHVTVWDSNRGISNYIFNEGVYVDDIYAYPKVEASYDAPLEIEKLCLNENPNKRYTCAFDKVKQWTIKNAEKALLEINGFTELDVLNEEFLSKFKELKQAIADDDSEKISELRMQLDELGTKIHNMKQ